MRIKRLFILFLFLGNALVLPAQSAIGWLVGQVVDNIIQEAIFTSVKETARGNIKAGSNNVIDNTTREAKKKGVRVAEHYPEVTSANLERVLADVSLDSRRMVSASCSSLPVHNTTLYFNKIAKGKVIESASLFTERVQNLSKYGISEICDTMSDSTKIRLLLGDRVSDYVINNIDVSGWHRFAMLIDGNEKFRRAFQLMPQLVSSYNRLQKTTLSKDVDFLCYDYSGANRYIRAGVLLFDSMCMPRWDSLQYEEKYGYTVIENRDKELARVHNRRIQVSDNYQLLNVALMPNYHYAVSGLSFYTDQLGRVNKVEGELYFVGRIKGDDKILQSFAHARKKYSRNMSEQLTSSYIIPLEYSGICAGINILPLQESDRETQRNFFREIKKEAKVNRVTVKVTIQYIGSSEVPSLISYSR